MIPRQITSMFTIGSLSNSKVIHGRVSKPEGRPETEGTAMLPVGCVTVLEERR